ncbi:MAG: CPBP family intramembrane metalloprotease, partial [Syntrophales bacterium LBB04]|nr:CPBP family intramembrane metalloprotease [Syntrophales bacterium LBB04]
FPFIACILYFVVFSEYTISRYIYTGTKIFTLLWPLFAYRYILKINFPVLKIDFEKNKLNVLTGILTGTIIVIIMFLFMNTGMGKIVEGCSENIKIKVQQLGIINHYWSFGLFLSIIHSFIEEYYWRWFVFGTLNKIMKSYASHLLAGIAFGAHHIVVATQYFPIYWGLLFGSLVGFGGIIFSILYDRQKTLSGAWVCHMIVDLGIIAIGHHLIFRG